MTNVETSARRFARLWRSRKAAVWIGLWALAVVVLAFLAPSAATVREQTEAPDAIGDLDAAVGDAAGLLTGKPYAYAVGQLRSEGECDITPVRDGVEYSRSVTVYAEEADVPVVVEELAEGLQDRYDLTSAWSGDRARYTGEISSYVLLELLSGENTVTWTARTGCRPAGGAVAQLLPDYQPPAAAVALLAELTGAETAQWSLSSAQCGDLAGPGGATRTARAAATLPDDADADVSGAVELAPEGASIVVARSDLVAFRLGDASTAITLSNRKVSVNSTVDCGAR
ncbi:MAG: hypothetical protein ACRDXX_02195 [Stackebrandtia sp.]